MIDFQPYEARSTLADASSSSPAISQLLQQQGANLGEIVNSLGNIGKINRTSTVNDLIARGGLEGLNEQQARQALLQASGGTLTPEGQAQVDKVLQTIASGDERKFKTSEREGSQQFTSGENVAERKFKSGESQAERAFKGSESQKERGFRSGESGADREFRASESVKDRKFRRDLQDDEQNTRGHLLELQFDKAIELDDKKTANELKKAQLGNNDTAVNMITKSATEQLLNNPKIIEEKTNVVQQLLDKDNILFNAKLDDQSKAVVGRLLYDGFDTKEGRKAIASGNPEAIKSYIDSELSKRKLQLDEGLFGGVSIKGK